MEYQRDYTNVVESTGGKREPVPADTYTVTISKIEETQTKISGLPMVKTRLKIMRGNYAGKYIFDQVPLFPDGHKAAGMTKHFLHMIGEPYQEKFAIKPSNWVGKKLTVTVFVDEQYNNNKVSAYDLFEDLP